MPEGANKSANELAKELAASLTTTVDGDVTVLSVENKDVVASDPPEIKESKKDDELDKPTLIRHYRVLVEAVTGASPKVEEQNISTLSGVVTDADLDAAGVDKAWLLKIGSIEDIGYHPV